MGNHDSLDKNTVTLENMETNTVLIQLATGHELEPLERRTWGYVLGLQKQTNKEKTTTSPKKKKSQQMKLHCFFLGWKCFIEDLTEHSTIEGTS